MVRARLGQAFGRLIRRQGDRGLFVILSSALPSRLLSAFPAEVAISRLPLDAALERVKARLFGEGVGDPVADRLQAEEIDPSLLGRNGRVDS